MMLGNLLKSVSVTTLLFGGVFVAVADPLFVDVTAECDIEFVGTYGDAFPATFTDQLYQRNMGNGAAVGDVDGDGDLDIYLLAQLGLPNVLLRNDHDLGVQTFTDVTEAAGVGDLGLSRVAHFADLDNDGDLDLVVVNDNDMNASYPASKIYRNDGDVTFSDVTVGSGFQALGFLRCGASLADYDGDGLLDIYVTNWGFEVGTGSPNYPGSNRLYRNLGGFLFDDVTEDVGLGTLARDSFAAIFHDFDGDLRPDIWVAIDHTSDEFFRNTPTGFVNHTVEVGATHTGNDMGLACADFDDDGDLDVYATNITDPAGFFGHTQFNAFNVNQADTLGSLQFVDEASTRGAEDTYWGWGVEFVDVENDGDLDIAAVTGMDALVGLVDPSSPVYQTPSVLLVNDSTGHFTRNSAAGLEYTDDSRALIAFDYDRDGDEDLLITNVNQPARLLENRSDPAAHWFDVQLVQLPGSNRNGIGATVRATLDGKTMRREIIAGKSYLSGHPAEVHFGLGTASTIDELHVQWTDGTQSMYTGVQVDRLVEIQQGVADADLDGVADDEDCDPADGSAWLPPGAASDLTASGSAETSFVWLPPDSHGGLVTRYDLVRSDRADFASATCVADDIEGLSAVDDSVPEQIYFYLVRVRNACDENAGADSAGTPRVLPDCP